MRLIIVEDDISLMKYCSLLLDGAPDIDVVGSFSTGEEALASLKNLQADILLADLGLPGISGIELIEKAKERFPDLDIIVHTIFNDKKNVFTALKKGAVGYLLKGGAPNKLIEAIYEVSNGGAPMSKQIARLVINEFQKKEKTPSHLLTSRETEILELMDKDFTYSEIADSLCISRHTVHTHIKHIYKKLHAKCRKEIFFKARKKGILY
ncbi:MAG: response regulator transcription factor [Deltaproteobacteria bacterium]|nr:response regulator transcription factor [Deltaproteobacteria bacterium]